MDKRITIRLSEQLLSRINEVASSDKASASRIIRNALNDYLTAVAVSPEIYQPTVTR